MRHISIVFVAVFLVIIAVPPADALWWMVFHKPAFNGKVMDAETKEPIEGAVVVAVYGKETISYPEHYSTTIDVRETLTDKDGMFVIPSYTTIIQPLSIENPTRFIIFKPWYGGFPPATAGTAFITTPLNKHLSHVPNSKLEEFSHDVNSAYFAGSGNYLTYEEFFSGEVGIEKNFWARELYNTKDKPQKIKLTFGVVELPRLRTREDMANSTHVTIYGYGPEKLPFLYRAINEELSFLGYPLYDLNYGK